MIKVEGRVYRLMGPSPGSVPALRQVSLQVHPTQTLYRFEGPGFSVDLSFTSPILPRDLSLASRPVTYLDFRVTNGGGAPIRAELHLDATAELAVESLQQEVAPRSYKVEGGEAWGVGTVEQPVLAKKGDDLRMDWGWAVLASTKGKVSPVFADESRAEFAGLFSGDPSWEGSRKAEDRWPGLAWRYSVDVASRDSATARVLLAYDDVLAIRHFEKDLPLYWRKDFPNFEKMLGAALAEGDALVAESAKFDRELTAQLIQDGGPDYAAVASLAYRQAWAGHAIALGADGEPLFFSKENFSNGCIATVDVTYPSAPLFFLAGYPAVRALLRPALDYGSSPRWKFPFAPHDLGTYPHATGQVYGGGEKTEENQMPVEECGNLLILVGAVCAMQDSADFAREWWPTLVKWADYLVEHGIDPANQLCTDDFAGHLARNANLSAKAIMGLGAFAQVCQQAGEGDLAAKYRGAAEKGAAFWVSEAGGGGDSLLAFGSPGTWGQKYNLVWDEILGLNLFPAGLAEREREKYVTRQFPFGLPLDNRADYTKLDWILWSACLGSSSQEEFQKLVGPVLKFLNETPNRVPMTDWYDAKTGRQVGFQARTVVGGVFLRSLMMRGLRK